MPISQCPRCELKFSTVSEMRWHLREDHPVERRTESPPLTVQLPTPRPTETTATGTTGAAAAPTSPRAARWWRRWRRRDPR